MRLWHILRSRLRSILFRDRRERDLNEELQLHIEHEIETRVADGVPEHEARHEALRKFGSVESLKEECRDARGTALVDHLRRDMRHAVRRLIRDWRFTVAAVLILGLGIGANTAIFSVVNATLFRESAFANPDRLVEIYQNSREGVQGVSSYPAYLDMAEYATVFARTTAVSVPNPETYLDRGAVRSGVVEYTTATYLAVLGLQPSRGRWFDASEDRPGTDIVGVISHEAWTRRFGADPSVVGRTIRMRGVPVTIVGIGPVGHNGTLNIGLVIDFWLPISSVPALGGPPRALERRPLEAGFFVKARLNDGVTVAQAQAAMDNLGRRLAKEYPNEDPGKGISVVASTDVRVHPQMDILLTAIASLLLGVVGLVLAIACSNLATLLLVRAAARAKEVSVRLAVGATRWQLIRHLLTESVLLSVTGGVAGCVLAWWIIQSLSAIDLPISVDFSLDYRVLAFALGLSLVTGVIFGLAPAFKATRVDLVTTLRDDGQTRSAEHRWLTLKNALVVFQVAVSAVLLAGTSVFLQMVVAARAQRAGFAVDGVAMLETDARYAGYSGVRATNLYEELRRRVAATPGVQSAVLTRGLPMEVTGLPLVIEGAAAAGPGIVGAGSIWAGPGFFETLRIPILFGRAIDERDREGAPRAAVISETMARQYFGGVNAVGRRFRIDQDPNWIEVVGVARDTGTSDLGDDLLDPTPQLFYRSPAQSGQSPDTVLARTSLDAAGLVGSMQRELRALDTALPVFAAETMGQHLEKSLMQPRAVAAFLGGLGAVGLSLAGIGLYAVIAFAVSRRSREIGIRMALGARSRQVVWNVARDVAVLIGAGTGVGMVLSVLLILAMRGFSNPAPGVGNVVIYSPTFDPLSLLAIAGFIAMVGMAAAFVPARRAARMDPLTTLRRD
ncbi:MAG TPA: ABC transporter permease [Vicinamibacterales bacterium]|nr:ABC transporter permease [Vicinamibacterales bacterium]